MHEYEYITAETNQSSEFESMTSTVTNPPENKKEKFTLSGF